MLSYIIKKVLILFFLIISTTSLLFLIIRLIPGNPSIDIIGNMANNEQIQYIEKNLDLDKPIFTQYQIYVKKTLNFDFGNSYTYKKKVSLIIIQFLPNTLYLSILAMFFAIIISFPLGVTASLYPNSTIDIFATIISSSFLAIPNFLLGPLLILVFSIGFNLLPVSGSGGFEYIILPALTLGLSMTAFLTKIIRGTFYAETNKPYVLFAKAKGLSNIQIVFKHIFKNAMIPVLTVMGLQFGSLISGVIITETVFSWQGLGTLLINGIRFRDYPLIQGLVLFILLMYLLINFMIDFSYLFFNPKLRRKDV